jgi:hypothetical protein
MNKPRKKSANNVGGNGISGASLFDLYEGSKAYRCIYGRPLVEEKLKNDLGDNFAGNYINLSNVVDFDRTMFNNLE